MSRFLEGDSVRTTMAGSGFTALTSHREDPADLIVTDLRMPDGDGVELIRNIRAENRTLPIVVVTGQVLREAETEALEAGATELLRKPLDLHELARAVKRHLPEN